MILLFWLAVSVLTYVYFGYPLMLFIISRAYPDRPTRDGDEPGVTVIITAYNEEAHIGEKLVGILNQDYPQGNLEIIVASDGSQDGTDDVVKSFASQGVRLLRVEGRLGKTMAQNKAVEVAKHELLVFTDATTHLNDDTIGELVKPFRDGTTGAVGGRLVYLAKNSSATGGGTKAYWEYEHWLKSMESKVGGLIGVSGCLYAVRKSLYRPLEGNLISDFIIALDVYEQGKRVVYQPGAMSFEETLEKGGQEFKMRVRVALRSLVGLWKKKHLLNPFRHLLMAFKLISHKVLRYLIPVFLLCALFSNAFLIDERIYLLLFSAQLTFYILAMIGMGMAKRGKSTGFLYIPYYFVLANAAAAVALVAFLRGKQIVTWEPQRS